MYELVASSLIYSTEKNDNEDEYDDLQDYSDDGDYAYLQYEDEYDLRGLYDYYELVASSPGRRMMRMMFKMMMTMMMSKMMMMIFHQLEIGLGCV